MNIYLDWKNIFYLFSQFVGYLVGVLLIVSSFKGKRNNAFLGFNFLLLTYSTFIIWLITTGYFVHFPHLYRTGNFTGMLFIPMMYLYIRSEVKKKPFSPWDLLHFLPPLVFLVDFWPILTLDVDQKLILLKSEISDPSLFTKFSQSRFFHEDFYTPFRSILVAIYWSFSVFLVFSHAKNQASQGFGRQWFVWIKIFLAFESMVFLPALLLNWAIEPITAYYLAHISNVVLNLGTGLSLLFFPKILYGLDQKMFEEHRAKRKSKLDILDQLSEKKIDEIKKKLETALTVEKKYLKHGYTIGDLSVDTGIPSYLLTLYVNNVLLTTFPDLINKERVEECCKMMESGKYPHLATEGFGDLCGFNNRNSFSLAFKKHKGVSPSAYYKGLR
jgi:AraC-like DNA-binding protein